MNHYRQLPVSCHCHSDSGQPPASGQMKLRMSSWAFRRSSRSKLIFTKWIRKYLRTAFVIFSYKIGDPTFCLKKFFANLFSTNKKFFLLRVNFFIRNTSCKIVDLLYIISYKFLRVLTPMIYSSFTILLYTNFSYLKVPCSLILFCWSRDVLTWSISPTKRGRKKWHPCKTAAEFIHEWRY